MLTNLTPAEFTRTIWSAKLDVIDLKNLLRPEWWAHVARMLKPNDRIEITAADGTRYIELIVASCGPLHARMIVLNDIELSKVPTVKQGKEKPDFFPAFKGPIKKWTVIREVDKEIMQEGLESREVAEGWIAAHKLELAGKVPGNDGK